VWILMSEFAAVRGKLEDPLWIDTCYSAREESGSFDDFTGDDPLRLVRSGFRRQLVAFSGLFFLRFAARIKRRAGEHGKQPIPCPFVNVSIVQASNMPNQTGKDGGMDGGIGCIAFVKLEGAQIIESVVQL